MCIYTHSWPLDQGKEDYEIMKNYISYGEQMAGVQPYFHFYNNVKKLIIYK